MSLTCKYLCKRSLFTHHHLNQIDISHLFKTRTVPKEVNTESLGYDTGKVFVGGAETGTFFRLSLKACALIIMPESNWKSGVTA